MSDLSPSGDRPAPGPSCRELGAAALREASLARAARRTPGPRMHAVRDLAVPDGPPARLYRPSPAGRPLVVFAHGGGFVTGDLDTHDGLCRHLARSADVAVLAVDARRAPEHPGPAAVDDVTGAALWAGGRLSALGADPLGGVSLAGDSSGGAVALLAGVRLVEADERPAALLLLCPIADLTLDGPGIRTAAAADARWASDVEDLRWFVEQWVPDPAGRTDPALSPLHADLRGLPPLLVATAEHDPLRFEGEALIAAARAAGVVADEVPHPGLGHGFANLGDASPAVAAARDALGTRFGALVRAASPR